MTDRLQISDLSGGYPDLNVFSGVGFSASSAEILAILGANGCGKSALLESIQGVLPIRTGTILLDGEPVHVLPPEARAARGMSLVSDRRRLWNEMTVQEHLRVGAFRPAARQGWRDRALGLRSLFPDLSSLLGARPAALSGGLQQQLALARFAMSSPRVWLLDDPLQGLDEASTGRVLDWIRNAARGGAAVILTGQHIHALLGVASKAMFLEDGFLSELPIGPDGLRDPRVRSLL
ncbi:MAG: ATP-binding cassette domain-containing protein [Thermoanaerobaculia bacterium]